MEVDVEFASRKLDEVASEIIKELRHSPESTPGDDIFCPAGMAAHMGFVLRYWVGTVCLGQSHQFPWDDGDLDADWKLGVQVGIERSTALFSEAVDEFLPQLDRCSGSASCVGQTEEHVARDLCSAANVRIHLLCELSTHLGQLQVLNRSSAGAS